MSADPGSLHENAIRQLRACVDVKGVSLLARLRLGEAYLRLGDLGAGELEFERLDEEIERDRRHPCETEGLPGDEHSVRKIRARARIAGAHSQIQGGVAIEEAIQRIRQVKREVCETEGDVGDVLAACDDVEGWGLFNCGKTEEAIECLNASVRRKPTAEAYLHLGQIYADRALSGSEPSDQRRDEARARQYAALARRLGLGPEQAKPLDEAIRRLDTRMNADRVKATSGGQQ